MTEEQIERRVERMMDALDAQLMNGALIQREYDSNVRDLNAWATVKVAETKRKATPMKNYEVTYEWPNGDWSWIYMEGEDFHKAMLLAMASCPRDCRVHHLQFMTAEQVAANKAHDGVRWASVGKHEARGV